MTLLALAQRHIYAHTDEQRAAARDMADELQRDTYPDDLMWAADATRTLTDEELVDVVPPHDRLGICHMAARMIETLIGVAVFLLVGGFVVAQAAMYWGVW